MTRRSCASSALRNIQPSAGSGRRVNEALALSRSSGSRTATTAVEGLGRCRACSPLTTSRGLRSSGIPAEAHSAGSSIRASGSVEAADRSADVDKDAAEDGANPKVTFLPSATRPHCGRGSDLGERAAAQPYRTTDEACGERSQFFLSNWDAATSNWGHRPFSGYTSPISLPTVLGGDTRVTLARRGPAATPPAHRLVEACATPRRESSRSPSRHPRAALDRPLLSGRQPARVTR